MLLKQKERLNLFSIYLGGVIGIGSLLLALSLLRVPAYRPALHFALLVGMVLAATWTTSSSTVSEKTGITYEIGSVVALASVLAFDPWAAVLLNSLFNILVWAIKPSDKRTWKKSLSQLGFNLGMQNIAIFLSGWLIVFLYSLIDQSPIPLGWLVWLLAGVIYTQINFGLLVIILRLQHGSEMRPWEMWKSQLWAVQLSSIVLAVGGWILNYGLLQYDWRGIAIFFMPTLLSAYAFRLYLNEMQKHWDNLEQIIAERTAELHEMIQHKESFLAVITHDMITPLTSNQMSLEAIRENPGVIMDNPTLLRVMIRSQKTLFDMVNNILDLEKLRAGGRITVASKSPTNLHESMVGSLEIITPEAQSKRIEVTYNHPDTTDDLVVLADERQLVRIFLNLISNGIKYTSIGGELTVSLKKEDQKVILDFTDTGYGISEQELPIIFERFKRGKELEKKATGTGLGLAITKALVEEHDGEITVISEKGVGTTFTVTLPLVV